LANHTRSETKELARDVTAKAGYLINFLNGLNIEVDFRANGDLGGFLAKKCPKLVNYGLQPRNVSPKPVYRDLDVKLNRVGKPQTKDKVLMDIYAQITEFV
jgi:hypothetical protein